ncbi:hypothetical protein [Frankia tisae]|uniref:hypothetical protein n=1 Tax=Frankia tisae TaxID=2950104 RepID=UPI0021C1ACB0|nr:hypothetical protein [Frankia tisae]
MGNAADHAELLLRDAPELGINLTAGTAGTAAETEKLWGFCRGGCTWTAHTFFGRPGNNPYCHHRALTHQRAGRRERLVQTASAPGEPFDHGLFSLVEESLEAPWPAAERPRLTAADIRWPSDWVD